MSRGYLCIWFTAKGELRWPIVNQYLLLRYSWLLWSFIAHKLMWDTIRWSTLIVVNDYLLQFLNKHHTIVEIEWSTSSFSITKWKQMAKKGGVEVLFNEEFFQHVSQKKVLFWCIRQPFVLPHFLFNTQFGKKASFKWALLVMEETADWHKHLWPNHSL